MANITPEELQEMLRRNPNAVNPEDLKSIPGFRNTTVQERAQTISNDAVWVPAQERRTTLKTPFSKPCRSSRKIPKTEQVYMQHLEVQKYLGEIVRWWHEPVKFILTHGVPGKINEMSYKIDFMVQMPGHIRFVEVKGSKKAEHEDSWVKLKATCDLFPCFEFVKAYVNTKNGEIQEEVLT